MAAVTFTASEWSNQPRTMESGVLTKAAVFTLAVAASVSSVYLLCKVPARATILDFSFYVNDAGGSATANQTVNNTWQLGLSMQEGSGSITTTYSAISPAQSNAFAGSVLRPVGVNLPLTVSLGDAVPNRWAWITAQASINPSASAVMKFTVKYTMDGA
jgi:hypothetical protein